MASPCWIVNTLTSESIPGARSSWRINSRISGMLDAGPRMTSELELLSAVTTTPARIPESRICSPSASRATIESVVDGRVTFSLSCASPSPVIAD